MCIIQADRAKTRWQAPYSRAESEFSRFFLLRAVVSRENRAAPNLSRSFRTVCKIFAPRIGPNGINGLRGAEIRCKSGPLPADVRLTSTPVVSAQIAVISRRRCQRTFRARPSLAPVKRPVAETARGTKKRLASVGLVVAHAREAYGSGGRAASSSAGSCSANPKISFTNKRVPPDREATPSRMPSTGGKNCGFWRPGLGGMSS